MITAEQLEDLHASVLQAAMGMFGQKMEQFGIPVLAGVILFAGRDDIHRWVEKLLSDVRETESFF